MENKEQEETEPQGFGQKKSVEVRCNERSLNIIQNLLLPRVKTDPFCKSTMDAVASAAEGGMPVNITVSGNDEEGRVSYVSNSLCTMISVEISSAVPDFMSAFIAQFSKFDINKDGVITGQANGDSDEAQILQMTIGNSAIIGFTNAILGAITPTFVNGCNLMNKKFDEPEGPEQDPPIPFPVKSDVGPEIQHPQADDGK
jgi:hypothetical protein